MAISTTGWKGIAALGFTAAAFVMLMGSGEPPKTDLKKGTKASGARKVADSKTDSKSDKPVDPAVKKDEHEEHDSEDHKADDVSADEEHSSNEPKATKSSPFVVSSHTNFNVVPHGVIKFGGKGKPGDKVLVSVDGKPAMKGTIKPNGRWTFDVKIKTAGGRTLRAQNLSTKESKAVKLKIK